jgi:hypothetical protein
MTKRRWIRWSLILLILAAFAVWLEPTRVVWGWLRGEAFYQGRPTSYWARQIEPWDSCCAVGFRGGIWRWSVVYEYVPKVSALHRWLSKYVSLPRPTWPAVLDSDAESAPVLHELLAHPTALVEKWAIVGIERMNTREKGPTIRIVLERDDTGNIETSSLLPGNDAILDDLLNQR